MKYSGKYQKGSIRKMHFRGLKSQPGFQITPRMQAAVIITACYGDLAISLYHHGNSASVRRERQIRRGKKWKQY